MVIPNVPLNISGNHDRKPAIDGQGRWRAYGAARCFGHGTDVIIGYAVNA